MKGKDEGGGLWRGKEEKAGQGESWKLLGNHLNFSQLFPGATCFLVNVNTVESKAVKKNQGGILAKLPSEGSPCHPA